MSSLVFNPRSKDFFKAKACVAISRRYNYAGSFRSYRFKYLSFHLWSSSYRASFCYVLKRLEDEVNKDGSGFLFFSEICSLFVVDGSSYNFFDFLELYMKPVFWKYTNTLTPVEKLSFVYVLLDTLIRYNLGEVCYDLASPLCGVKSAIRYAASKYFPDTSFIEIESDFMIKDVMD